MDLFHTEVGLGPKKLARILRLHHAIGRLRALPAPSLSRIAADLGFSDQAHFTREFSAMTGETPSVFRRASPYGAPPFFFKTDP